MSERVAIVTGAGSGIGRETAYLLASDAVIVICMDRDADALESAVSEIQDAGGSAVAVVGDVSTDKDCASAVGIAASYGRLDALINVAGIMVDDDRVESLSPAAWDRVIAVNLTSIFLLSRHAIPLLRRSGGGVIVNTASVHAFATMPANAAYAASKGAVVALTRQMALDCVGDGIRVVAVAPGSVDTPLARVSIERAGASSFEEVGFSRSPSVVGRVGNPSEVAQAIKWLASDAASFVNGSTLLVDGALLARLV